LENILCAALDTASLDHGSDTYNVPDTFETVLNSDKAVTNLTVLKRTGYEIKLHEDNSWAVDIR
jgi:hypothetical protein